MNDINDIHIDNDKYSKILSSCKFVIFINNEFENNTEFRDFTIKLNLKVLYNILKEIFEI